MDIGFIGAGKVGCTLGKYLNGKYATIVGYYSRTRQSADDAATFTQSSAFGDPETLIKACDTLFITTPDGVIGKVWECIRNFDLSGKIICHFSGSLSSDIFSGIGATGASCCSVHPMYAFSSRFTSYLQFNKACITVEGQEHAVKKIKELFADKLHHKVFMCSPGDKVKYHTAAAFASNYVTGAMHIAIKLLKECGFKESDAMKLLSPVSLNNLTSVLENGTREALTGPVERNDISTVEKHLNALGDGDIKEVYKSLGRVLISIAREKNPDRNYTGLMELMH